MRTLPLAAATLIAMSAIVHAAPPAQTVNLDGSVSAHSAARKSSLAASANRALQAADVPSTKTDPGSVKAAADADMAQRDKRASGPRLKAERQNLKGDAAAHAIAQEQTPATYDRSISMGDKDHTEQVTNLKVYIKK